MNTDNKNQVIEHKIKEYKNLLLEKNSKFRHECQHVLSGACEKCRFPMKAKSIYRES